MERKKYLKKEKENTSIKMCFCRNVRERERDHIFFLWLDWLESVWKLMFMKMFGFFEGG